MTYLTPREVAAQLRQEVPEFQEYEHVYIVPIHRITSPEEFFGIAIHPGVTCVGCALGKLLYLQGITDTDKHESYKALASFIPQHCLMAIDDLHGASGKSIQEIADILERYETWRGFDDDYVLFYEGEYDDD